jgi:protein-tyrosine phosphatase
MSRSATLTIAFIMKTRKLSFHDAYKFVKSKRRVAFPNTGFRAQLVIYERLNYNLEGVRNLFG